MACLDNGSSRPDKARQVGVRYSRSNSDRCVPLEKENQPLGILQAIKVAIHDRGQLDEKARDLVRYASIVATGLHGAVEEQLKGNALDFDRWSFFATAAAVDVGTTVLSRSMSEKEFTRLLGYIDGDLQERFGDAANQAMNNYREGTVRLLAELQEEEVSMEEADATLEGSLGAWVLNNTLSREIESHAEMRLAQAVGMMITQQFCQYWD
jgi:hypothetical protein